LIAILNAIKEESSYLKKGMKIRKISSYPDCQMFEGKIGEKEILLVLTGMGKEGAIKSTELALKKYPIKVMISTGFGGALNNKSAAGDVIIYSRLISDEVRHKQSDKVLVCDSDLNALASKLGHGVNYRTLSGNGVTISEVCITPEAKSKLGLDFNADVVDMESYWVGQTAREKNIPFVTIRSIFDAANDDLSLLNQITVEGKIKPLKVLSHLMCHPRHIKQASGYSANYRKAGKNLALFLNRLIEEI
jgi:adenosylhomocysteine nucleosidase